MDELVEAAKKNGNSLFIMGLDSEFHGTHRWIREIEGSGAVEALLLEHHPHFVNIKGTRKYVLKNAIQEL